MNLQCIELIWGYLYSKIISIMLNSSECLLSHEMPRFKRVPGWNDNVKEAHDAARYWFLEWVRRGRPRDDWVFEYMKITRNKFHWLLKACHGNEKEIRNQKIYDSFRNKDFKRFWRDIKFVKGSNKFLPSIVDQHNNDYDISNHFHDKFRKILDNTECQTRK